METEKLFRQFTVRLVLVIAILLSPIAIVLTGTLVWQPKLLDLLPAALMIMFVVGFLLLPKTKLARELRDLAIRLGEDEESENPR